MNTVEATYLKKLHQLHDPERLKALQTTGLLDSELERDFDRLAELTAQLLHAPLVFINFVDADRHYFKCMHGVEEGTLSRSFQNPLTSYCQYVILVDELYLINDVETEPLVNPLEKENALGMRAYMGTPLHTPDQQVIGTLCAAHQSPHTWTDTEKRILKDMSELVMKEIALRFYGNRYKSMEQILIRRTFELEEWQQRLQFALKAAHIGLYDWDLTTNAIHLSDELLVQIGESSVPEHIPPEALFSRIHPEDAPGIEETLNAYLARKIGQLNVGFRMQHKNGDYRWIISRGQGTWDDDGTPLRLIGIHVDITEQKQRIDFKRQRDTLAQLVEEQTTALRHANIKLEEKNKELLYASEVKSQFLATMSHEIRTPMNGVIGFTSLLLDSDLNYEQRDYVATIRSSGDALLDIINDILDFSKIETGNIELDAYSFVVHQIIEEAIDTITLQAYKKGLEIVTIVEPDVPNIVLGDGRRLKQILVNLLANAVKFTHQGHIIIKASITSDAYLVSEPITLHFSVQDTGIGIPEEKLEEIFDSFTQADPSTSRRYGGNGLGLSISKALCSIMGGTIWVESEEHSGSTFHFTAVFNATEESTSDSHSSRWLELQDKRVLVASISKAHKAQLLIECPQQGLTCHVISSDHELMVLHETKKMAFDVLMIDPHYSDLPEQEMKTILSRWAEHIPIIIINDIGATTSPFAVHSTCILHKPIKRRALFNMLEQSIRKNNHTHGTKPSLAQNPEALPHHELRILIAEDNHINQKLMDRFLQLLGYKGDIVENGQEVLTALQRQPYDVILMDVNMPVMDGIETTKILRTTPGLYSNIHIIGITADLEVKERNRCNQAGMNDFISKPMKLADLESALAKVSL